MEVVLMQAPRTEQIVGGRGGRKVVGTPFDEVIVQIQGDSRLHGQLLSIGTFDPDTEKNRADYYRTRLQKVYGDQPDVYGWLFKVVKAEITLLEHQEVNEDGSAGVLVPAWTGVADVLEALYLPQAKREGGVEAWEERKAEAARKLRVRNERRAAKAAEERESGEDGGSGEVSAGVAEAAPIPSVATFPQAPPVSPMWADEGDEEAS